MTVRGLYRHALTGAIALALIVAALYTWGVVAGDTNVLGAANAVATGLVVGFVLFGTQYVLDRRRETQSAQIAWSRIRPAVLKTVVMAIKPEVFVGDLRDLDRQLGPLMNAVGSAPIVEWAGILRTAELENLAEVVALYPNIKLGADGLEAGLKMAAYSEEELHYIRFRLMGTDSQYLHAILGPEPNHPPEWDERLEQIRTTGKTYMLASAFTPEFLRLRDAYNAFLTETDDDMRMGARYLFH